MVPVNLPNAQRRDPGHKDIILIDWVSEVDLVVRFSMGKDRMYPPMWFWLRDV